MGSKKAKEWINMCNHTHPVAQQLRMAASQVDEIVCVVDKARKVFGADVVFAKLVDLIYSHVPQTHTHKHVEMVQKTGRYVQ